MIRNRYSSHSVDNLQIHLVWITKYRYKVLRGEVQVRCRDLLRQVCDALDIQIMKGVVSQDHIHLHLSYPPKLSVSDIAKGLKGRSSGLLLDEFAELKKRYWGSHLWGVGYGAWSVGHLTDEMLQEYLAHHNPRNNDHTDNFILE